MSPATARSSGASAPATLARNGRSTPGLALAVLASAALTPLVRAAPAAPEASRYTIVSGSVPVSGGEEFCFSLGGASSPTERVKFQLRFGGRTPKGALVVDDVRGLDFRDQSEEFTYSLDTMGAHRVRLALDETGTLENFAVAATSSRIVKESCSVYEEEQTRRLDLRRAPPPPVNEFERERASASEPPAQPPRADVRPAPVSAARPATLHAGTEMSLVLRDAISTKTAYVGKTFTTHLSDGVLRDGRVVLPSGTKIMGRVVETEDAGRFGRSKLTLAFDRALLEDGREVALQGRLERLGKGSAKKQGGIIAGSAAGGALLGQLLGGDKEATLLGALAGAAIASGSIAAKPGEAIELQPGTLLTIALDSEAEVPAPR